MASKQEKQQGDECRVAGNSSTANLRRSPSRSLELEDEIEYMEAETAEEKKKVVNEVEQNLRRAAAGGFAGIVAKAVVAPVERLKIMYQVTDERFSVVRMADGFRLVVRREGLAGLWRGYSATMLKVFPYAGIQFASFDRLKKWVLARERRAWEARRRRPPPGGGGGGDGGSPPVDLGAGQALACGAAAGAASIVATYPLDLLRTMLAVERERGGRGAARDAGLLRTARSFLAGEGIRGLYRGVTPTIIGILPYAGIAFMSNEHFKTKLRERYGKTPPVYLKLIAGGISGLMAQSVSYPFEVIRRRMQTEGVIHREAGLGGVLDGRVPEPPPGGGGSGGGGGGGGGAAAAARAPLTMTETARELVRAQGVRGLFKGLSINWVRAPVAISISFTAFDHLKPLMGVR